jgi:hypothetical protein
VRGRHPYRFPGKPNVTFASAIGETHVKVYEMYGGYETVEVLWPVEEYRKAHRWAPQDLVVQVPLGPIEVLTHVVVGSR